MILSDGDGQMKVFFLMMYRTCGILKGKNFNVEKDNR